MANVPPEQKPPTEATLFIQVLCIIALVTLALASGFGKFQVPIVVYAIIAGILFGVGSIKDIFGGGK